MYLCMCIRNVRYFSKIIILPNCKEKYLVFCAVELEIKLSKLMILSFYRSTTGDFKQFIKNLDDALKHLYILKAEFSICGDINTEYLSESNHNYN